VIALGLDRGREAKGLVEVAVAETEGVGERRRRAG
jgi:hypothetical protein